RRFKNEYRDYQQQEERRLAYVAFTRARSDLLLSGAHWAGQVKPRQASAYLRDAIDVLGLAPIDGVDPEDNPYDGPGMTRSWPMDPLGDRRPRVAAAEQEARAALDRPERPAPTEQLARLLVERAERQQGAPAEVPTRVPASRFKDW